MEPTAPVRSLYVHAPFCARRCSYCDFAVTVDSRGDAAAWLDAVGSELLAVEREGRFLLADELSTLYVGGGTPSLLGPHAMAALRDIVGAGRLGGPDLEWTAEANPESLSLAVAAGWRAAGVNRLSIGVQTFHEPALRWMGRLHGSEGAVRAVGIAKRAGYANVSVDLIFALPASLDRSWADDLERALALDVPHVSLYGLSVEAGTALGRAVAEGREAPVDEERYRDEFLLAAETLASAGYEHYEVSNFARPGHASRHNAVYWDGRPYLGLGNGAHSYLEPVRRWNVRSWEAYSASVRGGALAIESEERVAEDARRLERAWLGLRTSDGIDVSTLPPRARELAAGWELEGLAHFARGRLRLTPAGWLELDRLTVELDAAGARGVTTGLNR